MYEPDNNSAYMQLRYNMLNAEANYGFIESDSTKSNNEKLAALAEFENCKKVYIDYMKKCKNSDFIHNAPNPVNGQLESEIEAYIKSVEGNRRAGQPLAKLLLNNWYDAAIQLDIPGDRYEKNRALDTFIKCKYDLKNFVEKGLLETYDSQRKLTNHGIKSKNKLTDPKAKG